MLILEQRFHEPIILFCRKTDYLYRGENYNNHAPMRTYIYCRNIPLSACGQFARGKNAHRPPSAMIVDNTDSYKTREMCEYSTRSTAHISLQLWELFDSSTLEKPFEVIKRESEWYQGNERKRMRGSLREREMRGSLMLR